MTTQSDRQALKFNVRINQHRYSYADLLRVWVEADRLGYYSASLYDLLNADALECWTTLTALLAQTQRLRAVPMVLSNPYRHPALLAKMVATLDVISGGRITLGIGAGGSRRDALASGLHFPSTRVRCEMVEEAVDLIRLLWTEPSVDFRGQFYSVAGASVQPKPGQTPAPPILVGGHGERYVLPTVGRIADICNIGSNNTVAEHQQRQSIVNQAAEAAGRNPEDIEITHNSRVVVAPTQHEFDQLVAHLAEQAGMTAAQYTLNTLTNTISGTPEQCAERISEYTAAGIHYFFVIFPDFVASETLELFAHEVMSKFNTVPGPAAG